MTLNEMKDKAIEHAKKVAQSEIRDLRDRLQNLYPGDMPVTIQLFQPVEGGRLVDVGPRPKNSTDSLAFQQVTAGQTGDIFQDEQAPHRFIPNVREIGSTPKGTFTDTIMSLEKMRYPNIGTWSADGPPANAVIHQLPLASLPIDLHPRISNNTYRFANLGAVYTISGESQGDDDKKREKMLILYALRAGEIAQRVRFETICGQSQKVSHITESRRHVVSYFSGKPWPKRVRRLEGIDDLWKDNVDGGLCRLVGSLILNHHWWFPYDPIAYHILCRLNGSDNNSADNTYYLHLCAPPVQLYDVPTNASRETNQLIAILCEDITYIIRGLRGTVSSKSSELDERIVSSVLTMLIQFTGTAIHKYCDKDIQDFIPKDKIDSESIEVQFIDFNPKWVCSLREWNHLPLDHPIRKAIVYCPIIPSTTIKSQKEDYCEFVSSLLAPNDSPLPTPTISWNRTSDGVVSYFESARHIIKPDPSGKPHHFLYWHTRAMLNHSLQTKSKTKVEL